MPSLFSLLSIIADKRAAKNALSEVHLLPLLTSKNELSCDVGSNRGLFSYWMLRHGVRVAAFEPNPHVTRVLRHRFLRAIHAGQFRVFEVALGDVNGEAVLHVPKGFSPLGTISGGLLAQHLLMEQIPVACRRLDDCILEPVGFIKIDVEGHEQCVLDGAQRILSTYLPSILVEAEERHRSGAVASIRAQLEPLGYVGFFCDGDRLRSINDFDPSRHQMVGSLNDAGTAVRAGSQYVNNFIFVARPDVRFKLLAWPHEVASLV